MLSMGCLELIVLLPTRHKTDRFSISQLRLAFFLLCTARCAAPPSKRWITVAALSSKGSATAACSASLASKQAHTEIRPTCFRLCCWCRFCFVFCCFLLYMVIYLVYFIKYLLFAFRFRWICIFRATYVITGRQTARRAVTMKLRSFQAFSDFQTSSRSKKPQVQTSSRTDIQTSSRYDQQTSRLPAARMQAGQKNKPPDL